MGNGPSLSHHHHHPGPTSVGNNSCNNSNKTRGGGGTDVSPHSSVVTTSVRNSKTAGGASVTTPATGSATTVASPGGKNKHVSINNNNRTISAITDHNNNTTDIESQQQQETQVPIQSQQQQQQPTTCTSRPQIRMDESAHTFGPTSKASASGHFSRRQDHVMITDALKDVRVNYHIEPKELGHGHYGVVRKCMHRQTGNWYAIKSIRKSKVSKIEVLKREIEILKEVKHPHIIELIEVFEDERYLHLITELCTGGELFDRIIAKTQSVEGHFSEHDAAQLVCDILDAIRYCHDEKGIVHRDLKPENFLFLTQADNAPVKIIDFGLSRHDDTTTGIMQTKVGTPYYVAPEVLRREYTNSCDIWSIGVITYILLCGYPPFYGDSDTQIFDAVRVGKFDFPSPEWDEISQTAKDFVKLMLQKDPKQRPTAAQALGHKWLVEQLGLDGISNGTKKVGTSIKHRSVRTGNFANYLAMKRLKKAALTYIASNLTQAEVGTLKELFESMDTNHDGSISLSELDEAIARGNFSDRILHDLRQLRAEHAVMIGGVEHMNKDQKIDWRDFVASTMDRSVVLREDNMRRAFEHFRHSHAEYITIDDLADIFGSKVHAHEVMDMLDIEHEGKVSYENFRLAIVESMDNDASDDDQDAQIDHEIIS